MIQKMTADQMMKLKSPPVAMFEYAAECPFVGDLLADAFDRIGFAMAAEGLRHMARVGRDLAKKTEPVKPSAEILPFPPGIRRDTETPA